MVSLYPNLKIAIMIKKMFLLLFLSLVTTSVFAQFGFITISSNTNQKFWLFIDDVLQNEYATQSIRIQGLQYIQYKVRVEMDNPANNCVGQIVLISNMPNNNNYIVSVDRMNNYIFGQSKAMVNPFLVQNVILPDYAYFSSYQKFLYPGFNPNVSYGQGNQSKGNQYKRNQHNPQANGSNPRQGTQGHGTPTHGVAMPPPDFNKAIAVIQNETFENTKLSTAKQVASNNNLTVSQIVQICRLFSHEQTKLDFAKYAYPYCIDKNNYYQLNEVFTYSISKDELRKFIGN